MSTFEQEAEAFQAAYEVCSGILQGHKAMIMDEYICARQNGCTYAHAVQIGTSLMKRIIQQDPFVTSVSQAVLNEIMGLWSEGVYA